MNPLRPWTAACAAALLFAVSSAAIADDASQPTPGQMVDALHTAFGDHHTRAVHAKGVLALGVFEPSPEAASLTRAVLFSSGPRPVLARFSDFTGIPDIPDTVGDANPRGLALKFTLADGGTADVVAHSFNGFPTATAGEFRQLLLAIPVSGPGAAKPTPLDVFLASHPIAKTFLTTQKPPAESFTTLAYFAVNSFTFTNAAGVRTPGRYRFVPDGGEAFLTPEQLKTKGPNYLQEELPTRLAKGPVSFTWYAQIGEAGDAISDPSIAWPESRKLVKLGVIRLDRMAPDQATASKTNVFLPLNVPAGIDPADPMLGVRQNAYPISFAHRQ